MRLIKQFFVTLPLLITLLTLSFDVLAASKFDIDAGLAAPADALKKFAQDYWLACILGWCGFCFYVDFQYHGHFTFFARLCCIIGSIGILLYAFIF